MADIKNLKPKFGRFKQGYYKPKNPSKYLGDLSNIIFRSSWEYKFMCYCDLSSSVLQWSSEPVSIPYTSPIDGKKHKYFVDFYCEIFDGVKNQKYLVEVKPVAQYLKQPIFEGKKTPKKLERYKQEMTTYIVNNAKFSYATQYAKNIGMEFKIITEKELDF